MPHTLAAGLDARYQPRVVRRPAARAPGVRSGRSCHTQPTRPGSLPYGQPSATGCLRIRAYGSPLTRPASGRVLSQPFAAVWPNARSTGRVVSVRHARPSAHTLRAVVRSAALSGLSAHVQSISQRGRQTHAAASTHAVTALHQLSYPCTAPVTPQRQRQSVRGCNSLTETQSDQPAPTRIQPSETNPEAAQLLRRRFANST